VKSQQRFFTGKLATMNSPCLWFNGVSNESPLVSVIIPSKDRPGFVLKAIESTLRQTYRNIEIIVVDDASDPPLLPLLSKNFGDKIICLRHEYSQGAPTARNLGISNAKGKYIAFLDDDDIWLPRKIEKQMRAAQDSLDDIGVVFCSESLVYKGECIKILLAVWTSASRVTMLSRNVLGGTSSVLIQRKYWPDGGFDTTLPSCQDWDLFLRIVMKANVLAIPDILVHRNIHRGQISSAIKKRLIGRKLFYKKHRLLIDAVPAAKSQHFRRIGSLLLLMKQNEEAGDYFLVALKSNFNDFRNWIFVLVNALLPKKIVEKILCRYSFSKIGSETIFH